MRKVPTKFISIKIANNLSAVFKTLSFADLYQRFMNYLKKGKLSPRFLVAEDESASGIDGYVCFNQGYVTPQVRVKLNHSMSSLKFIMSKFNR